MARLLRFLLLLAASLVVPSALAQSPRVLITEISAEPDSGVPEFVELLVQGTSPLAADRIAIRDSRPVWRPLPFDVRPLLPGSYVIVTSDTSALRAAGPAWPPETRLFQVRPWPSLNNAGDTVAVAIDGREREWTPYHGGRIPKGSTAERRSPEVPAHAGFNWTVSRAPGGTPGAQNAAWQFDREPPRVRAAEYVDADTVFLWMSEPLLKSGLEHLIINGRSAVADVDESGPDGSTRVIAIGGAALVFDIDGISDPSGNPMQPARIDVALHAASGDVLVTEALLRGDHDWVELAAVGSRPVSLRRVELIAGSATASLAPPDSTLILDPGQVVIVPVSLPVTGSSVTLRDRLVPTSIDSAWVHAGQEDARFRSHTNRSLERIGPGPEDWASSLSAPTSPGEDHSAAYRVRPRAHPEALSLVLTEVLYQPIADPEDGQPDQSEFLEWVNDGTGPVDLFGAYLTFGADEAGRSDTLQVGYQPITLEPGGLVVLSYVPPPVPDAPDGAQAFLQAAWPDMPADTPLMPTRQALGLRDAGRRLVLHARDGTVLSDDTYVPDMHHPSVAEPRGRSLSRVRTAGGWSGLSSTAAAAGATPGSADVLPSRTGSARDGIQLTPSSIYPNHPEWGATAYLDVSTMGVSRVSAIVYDLRGRVIRHIAREVLVQGHVTIPWDGRTDSGNVAAAGLYAVVVHVRGADDRTRRFPVAVLTR